MVAPPLEAWTGVKRRLSTATRRLTRLKWVEPDNPLAEKRLYSE